MKPLVYKKAKRIRHQAPVRVKMAITKGDSVQVLSGDDKGKRGRVLQVFPKTGRITLEGVNIITKHVKATLIEPNTNEPTRVGRQARADGTVERVGVKSGQSMPRSR